MENRECEFNLLDEPWIKVMKRDGTIDEVSLTTVFEQAHLYTDLAGELATQNVAVLRLLLAVLHTVFSRVDEHGEDAPIEETDHALDRWGALWNKNSFPIEPIKAYLHTQHEKFWLFHPERPFGQALSAAKGTEYSAAKLIGELSESSNKIRLFLPRTGKDKTEISYAEAARWLLYVNGFDDSSVKNISENKKEKFASPGVGWLGKLGLLFAKGQNLFETLMLNLVLLQNNDEIWKRNQPEWELEKSDEGQCVEVVIPDNPAELLTLQSRKIVLIRANNRVTGYKSYSGSFFSGENAFNEKMTVWKPIKEKKKITGKFQPKRHDFSKQMWRDFAAFVDQKRSTSPLPGISNWINFLQHSKCINEHEKICFCAIGIEYGANNSSIADIYDDSLSFYLGLLTEAGDILRNLVLDEISKCDDIAEMVGRLAADLVKAAGGRQGEAVRLRAKGEFYFRLDIPFRKWLSSLDSSQENVEGKIAAQKRWRTIVREVAQSLGEELVENAGTAAFVGRMVTEKIKGKEVTNHYCAPEVYNKFSYHLKESLK